MEPSLATELAESLSKAPNLSAASMPPARVAEAAIVDSTAAAAPAQTPPDPKEQPPKKKPKAPRPEAGLGGFSFLVGLFKTWSPLMCQGSDMEITIVEETDLDTFIQNWKNSCTTAEGKATTVKSSPFNYK